MAAQHPVDYRIFCVVVDEICSFSVKISPHKTVGHLKDAIKAKRSHAFGKFDADELDLYLINLADDDSLIENVEGRLAGQPPFQPLELLRPTRELSALFPCGPNEDDTVHILVQPPQKDSSRKHGEVAKEEEYLKKLWKLAPSFLARSPSEFRSATEGRVYCNRPWNPDTIPIDLFQPEFGEFKKDCALAPTMWAQELLCNLTKAVCKWHGSETARRSKIHEVLKEAGLYFRAETINGTEYKTDGHWRVNIMPPAIRGCKNEAGAGCALHQAIAYYANFLKIPLRSYRHSRFPCILMVDVGPSIAFYGCLWTGENLHAEPLTPTYDLTTHWANEIARNAIASSLDAFKKTIGRLERYYKTLDSASPVIRTFPYPTSYSDKSGRVVKFRYQSRIDEKLVFRALGDDDEDLCVKFTKRYSEEVHQFLAGLGHAPQLRAVTSLPADWTMVVMDFSQFVQLVGPLPRLILKSRGLIQSKIHDIVQKLHDNGFVHGDIRDVNVLVDPETLTKGDCSVHLIDFDWAGKDQEVRYPARINTISVRRPEGVSDGELITKSHDMDMVSRLFLIQGVFQVLPDCI